MESREQLQIFMDINENQKAVSKNLRLDLEEDINWDSKQVDSRLKALRSSIIKDLSADTASVLANHLTTVCCNRPYFLAPQNRLISKTLTFVCITFRTLIMIRQ